jgi:hypothetical protein
MWAVSSTNSLRINDLSGKISVIFNQLSWLIARDNFIKGTKIIECY